MFYIFSKITANQSEVPGTDSEEPSHLKFSSTEFDANNIPESSVADPDPGFGAFLTPGPGSGIWHRFFPDPGSQTHIFARLVTNFKVI
jgi:hypothetical protein